MALPRWFELALAQRGVKEVPGSGDNPLIQAYYRDAGHAEVRHDSVPWCAAFVGAMLKRAGIRPSGSLAARSYLSWGRKIDRPVEGCIAVFSRGRSTWLGHVGFFVKDLGDGRVQILGGNQSDRVSLAAFPKSRLLGYRLPN
jgi:uncharacterized protein (TIGR02594 family)